MGPPNNFTRVSHSEQEFEQEGWDEIENRHAGRSQEQALDDILLSAASRYPSIQAIVAITLSSPDLPVELLPSSIDGFTASKPSSRGLGGIFLVRATTARIKISILKGSERLVCARRRRLPRRLVYEQCTSKVYKCIGGRFQEFTYQRSLHTGRGFMMFITFQIFLSTDR